MVKGDNKIKGYDTSQVKVKVWYISSKGLKYDTSQVKG